MERPFTRNPKIDLRKERLIAQFGEISLVRDKRAVLIDRTPPHQVTYPRKELVHRLLARRWASPSLPFVAVARSFSKISRPHRDPLGGASS